MSESGWIIEYNDTRRGVLWWDLVTWTTDSLEAIRFARKEDAEGFIQVFDIENSHATYHVWDAMS